MKKNILVLFALLLTLKVQAQQPSADNPIGAPVIPFTATDMTGATYSSELLRGKVVVLNLWSTTCKPCILEMPTLNQLKQEYAGKDVVFVSMALEDKATIKRFLKKHAFDFIVLPGSARYMLHFGNSVPQTLLIDKAGIVRDLQKGTLPVTIHQNAAGEKVYHFESDGVKAKINVLLVE